MSLFLFHILLTVVYLVLVGNAGFLSIVTGFVIGYIVMSIYAAAAGQSSYLGKGLRLFSFLFFFIAILIKANLQVAWEIITPGFGMQPRIIRYSVEGLSLVQITVLANLISLTPGTLSADVDDDGAHLYIHAMYAGNRDAAVADLDRLKYRMMREVFGQ